VSSLTHLYPRSPAIIAHRGASGAAPENTLAAFNLAVTLGADAVELDVKLSKDGVPVIMHDATVDRTTNGSGEVRLLTLAELKKLDAGKWKGDPYIGEPVPTLEDVFQAVASQVWINVELTNYSTPGDALVAKVVALIRAMNLQSRVLLSSFDPRNLRQARKLDPTLPLAQLTAHDMAIYLREAWLAPFAPHLARHPDVEQLRQKGVAWYHKHGYKVNVWTINDPDEMRLFIVQGVDGLITDVPDVARGVIGN
jgi:glycerophosphoryl diester phosphodiesterase